MHGFSIGRDMVTELTARELAECLGELPDLPCEHTDLLLLQVRIDTRRQRLTDAWWQWLTERVQPVGC